jgi:ATP-binding cassette, subfamily B (MDR/TAP), member 1
MSGNALAFWQGYRMYQSGEIGDVGTVFTVVLSVTLGATSILFILPQVQSITAAASAASELFSVMDKPSELDPLSTDGKRPGSCTGNIEIHNLRFTYPSRPTAPVLQDLSVSIPAGKTTALVGPSGCGKSTIVGLLERWYQPSSGQITLDGTEISSINTHWLRSNIRLVQQEPTLFQGTIFQNLVNGLVGEQHNLSEKSKMQLIEEACKAADAHDFIMKLPRGYQTQLGENAGTLSGGQRQRISIARSIISDPKILLFDEATSALDPRAEKVVQSALDRVSKNKTTLVIAHKLATIKNADNIAVMNGGKVVEQGSHQGLLEKDGLYAAMVRAQDLGAEAKGEDPDDVFTDDEGDDIRPPTTSTLQRTQSEAMSQSAQDEEDHLSAGTLGYPLIKCITIMLKEQPDLYTWYIVTAVAGLVLGGSYPGQAVIFSRFIGVFRQPDGQDQANFWALMFFVLALANLAGYFAIGWSTNTIAQNLTLRLRREMIQRLLSFDQEFFDRFENSSGALTSKLSSVPAAVQELMSANLGSIVNVIVNVTSCSILAIAFGWKLGLTMVFGGLTIIVGSGYIRIRLDQRLESSTEKQAVNSAGLATEAVSAIRTVSLLTLESSVLLEYSETLDSIIAKIVRSLVCNTINYI